MRLLRGLLIAAALGLLGFGLFVWSLTDLETVPSTEAARRFDAVRTEHPGEPLLLLVPGGGVEPNPAAVATAPGRVRNVCFLVHRVRDDRLLRLEVPFWFYRFKEPSTRFFLARLGVDMAGLHITSAQLAGRGPGPVLDTERPGGDRLLVWLE